MTRTTARAPLLAGTAFGVLTLGLLHAWTGWAYWNYSEGVYLLSARLLREGVDLYGHVVGAQPPGVFLFGAVVQALHDGLGWARLAVGAVQLSAGVLGAVAVWRITANRVATAVTPAFALLTPWAVHEHGTLTPDVLGAPLLLGAALLASRPRTMVVAGALAAVAPMVKFPFIVPALAIVVVMANWRAAIAFAGVLCLEIVGASAAFGSALWHDTVVAQLHIARHKSLHVVVGFWGQEGWSEFGLVLPALGLWWLRGRVRDMRLLLLLAVTAAGLCLTLITNIKQGTSLTIVVPLEAVLVPLALSCVALARGRARLAAAAGPAICLVMTISLMASPRTAFPFIYPGSQRNSYGRVMSDANVRAAVAQIGACPRGSVYVGPPFLAYLARRRMPDDQPDQFLTKESSTLRDVLQRMDADSATHCP